MRSRKPARLTDGPLQKGAIPWRDLPGWVQERVSNQPWDQTEDDKKVQALYEGYILVFNPYTGYRELWVSTPPKHKNGFSKVTEIHWPDEPKDAVDERILFLIRKYDPERGIDKREADRLRIRAMERLQRDKAAQLRLSIQQDKEALGRILTANTAKTGISIVVPDNLLR